MMKYTNGHHPITRRIVSLLLAFSLVFGMIAPAFAQEAANQGSSAPAAAAPAKNRISVNASVFLSFAVKEELSLPERFVTTDRHTVLLVGETPCFSQYIIVRPICFVRGCAKKGAGKLPAPIRRILFLTR